MKVLGPLGFVVVLIGITVGSLIPAQSLGSTAAIPDWLRHGVGYGLLAFFAAVTFMRFPLWLIFAAVVGYGIVIEVLQPIVADRSQELSDVVSNTIGALIGVLIAQFTRYRFRSPRQ
jgi:VanZ family protein